MPQNRLARLRRGLGWNQAQLADFMGVSSRTIYRWERGDTGIPDQHKARLCDLFGVSLDHLLGRGPAGNGKSEAA